MTGFKRIGFLGSGRMASALARGWIAAGLASLEQIIASDPSAAARDSFRKGLSVETIADNLAVVRQADLLVLAVKPQSMPALLNEIRPSLTSSHLILSIAAGVTLAQLEKGLAARVRLVRAMPNTPCLVGASASGYAAGEFASQSDIALVDRLLNAVGKAFRVSESLLDAVTGLSGSGPAYVFLMIEALADGGVLVGLPRDVALTLAAQTLLGSARMLLETGLHPGLLKDMVTSPGGTTIAGLQALELGRVRGSLMNAVEAATNRARELGIEDRPR